jgi:hypothetical protein
VLGAQPGDVVGDPGADLLGEGLAVDRRAVTGAS